MPQAPLPDNELARLQSLRALQILDSAPEEEFDALVKTAAIICEAPICAISLVDSDRQWFKAVTGMPGVTQTPRSAAFCGYTIRADGLLEVPDALADPRFADNELVLGEPNIRFYAGMPLKLGDGSNVGALCVIDTRPRVLSEQQKEALRYLSIAVIKAMENRMAARSLIREHALSIQYMEMVPMMSHSINAQGRIVFANLRWLESLGYTRDEVTGRLITDFYSEESQQRARNEVLPQLFKTGRIDNIPYQMVCKSGKLIDVLITAVLLKDQFGNVNSISLIENITDRLEAQREERSLFEAVQSQFIVSIHNLDGDFVEVNDTFCAISGYTRDELLGKNEAMLRSGKHPDWFFEEIMEKIKAGLSTRCDISYRSRSGQLYWGDCVIAPLYNSNRKIDRYIILSIDVTDWLEQNETIQKNAERMLLATNSGGIGVWEYDLVSNEVSWEGWMFRLYGLENVTTLGAYELWDDPASQTQEEIAVTYDLWVSFIHPEDRTKFEHALQAAIQGRTNFNIEYRIVWRDGSVHHLRSTAVVDHDNAGNSIRMVGANWDVTQLRELSGRLAEHDELMRVTLMSIAEAVVTTDPDSNITWMNSVAERLSGWTCQEVPGLPLMQVFKLIDQDSRLPVQDPVKTCLDNALQMVTGMSQVLISRSGIEFSIENSASPIKNENGKVLGAVLTLRDVSELRLNAEKLKFSEERFNLAVMGANDGLWDRNLVLGTVYYSPRWKSMLGYAEDELEDTTEIWDQLTHPDDKLRVLRSIDATIKSNTDRFSNEYRMRHKDGHYVWILDRGLIIRAASGEVTRFIGFHTDISEQKEVEKLKSEFISTVSHELRTPLTSISGALGLLDAGMVGELPVQAHELVNIAHKNSRRLATLVNDILDMEKLLSGKVVFKADDIDMVELIRQAVEMNADYAKTYGTHFELLEPDRACHVIGDRDRLMQVMANLMSNAAKFNGPGSAVQIRIARQERHVKVAVEDHGPGIPVEFRDRIFGEFAQANSGDTRQQGGTGLGLNITKKLLSRMDGEIGYETELGLGSVFWFTLPVFDNEQAQALFQLS